MKKTSLYIDPALDRALTRRAAAEGVSKAEFVRRVLAAAVVERPRPLARGVFEGARDLGAETDRHLAETGFGE
ncbi:MAG: ribbon-helix-helix domain-containing protein [Actinomycetota bacterium]|jgi:plasmid stability protein|nr:ribbon-helix-helix domain-containing protein [Actinomycetota bacterium]